MVLKGLNKRVHHFPETWLSGLIGELLILLSTKVNKSAVLFYSTAQTCCRLHLIKQNCLLKLFSRNTNLGDSNISLSLFFSRTNLKLHNISVTPKMVRKVITNLDLSKTCGPDCIPRVVLKNCYSKELVVFNFHTYQLNSSICV